MNKEQIYSFLSSIPSYPVVIVMSREVSNVVAEILKRENSPLFVKFQYTPFGTERYLGLHRIFVTNDIAQNELLIVTYNRFERFDFSKSEFNDTIKYT